MEEWHQKLHNNTSPDDVIICQALIAYVQHDLDISQYWKTLQVQLFCAVLKADVAAYMCCVTHAYKKPSISIRTHQGF